MCDFKAREFKEEMTKKYFSMIYKLVLNQTKNRDIADDVVQDVFLKYIQKDVDFKSEEHIKAWLIRVAINCSKSVFTGSWYRKTTELTDDITFETPEKSDVYYAVLQLPQKYRAVIHLFYYEDMSVSEIAKILKRNESTVKSQLHRARTILKSKLKGEYDYV